MKVKICVVGSVNLDYLVYADKFPQKSETMFGYAFNNRCGGKGANQAIAASKLGADTIFIGALGQDDAGDKLINNFKSYGVDVEHVIRTNSNSGVAICTIAENTNHIIVVKGANELLNKSHIDNCLDALKNCDLVILQNEINLDVTKYVAKLAKEMGKVVVLNPAPSFQLDQDLIDYSTFIIPNEVEVMEIFGNKFNSFEDTIRFFPNKLIVTYGSKGAYFYNGKEIIHCPAIKSQVVDTTGAGDCFIGSFSAEYIRTKDLKKSIEFAIVSAGLKVRNKGAQSSIPDLEMVRIYLSSKE